jgi:hypothetical protein
VTGAVLSPVVDVESAPVVDESELEAGADPAPEELSLLAAGAAGLSVVVVASAVLVSVLVAVASPAVELSGAAVDGLAVESVDDAFVEVAPAAATWLVSEPLESTVDAGVSSGKVSNIL